MNLVEQNQQFENTYVENHSGNVFEAINQWVDDADKLISKTQSRLSINESLSSLLTSELPDDLFKRKRVKDMEQWYVERYIREALSQIDDKLVQYSVLITLQSSRVEKNLVFKYLDTLTDAQKSRVRVISKLVWYNLYPREAKNDGRRD